MTAPVTAIAVSPDRSRVATACSDGALRVFATTAVAGAHDHSDVVAVHGLPDGQRLVTRGDDAVDGAGRQADRPGR